MPSNTLHPSHVEEQRGPSQSRAPQWHATYCANCCREILTEVGDVTSEGEQPCTAEVNA